MINFRLLPWRNRLLSWFPIATRVSELRHMLLAAKTWRTEGWTSPVPFFVRRGMLLAEARAVSAETFVETGTFLGDTTWHFRDKFKSVHTLEVQPKLAAVARERFQNTPSITLHEGDSALLLPGICDGIKTPCLFYLDGHYSGGDTGMGEKECPVFEEMAAIFNRTKPAFRIVIDDARLFGTHQAYPALDQIRQFLDQQTPHKEMRVENDAIIIF